MTKEKMLMGTAGIPENPNITGPRYDRTERAVGRLVGKAPIR